MCNSPFLVGINHFEKKLDGIVSGSLTIGQMEMLIKEKTHVIALFKALEKQRLIKGSIVPETDEPNVTSVIVLNKIMEWREAEIQAFREQITKFKQAECFLQSNMEGMSIRVME